MSGGVCSTRDTRLCHRPAPTYDEVKREQSATTEAGKAARKAAGAVVKEAAVEGAAHGIEAGLHAAHLPALGAATPYAAGALASVEITGLLMDIALGMPKEAGKALNNALAGQNQDVAILMIAAHADPGSVPSGYLAHRAAAIGANRFQHVSFRLASEVASRAALGDPKAIELRNAVVHNVNTGRAEAYKRYITCPELLAQANKDPGFKRLFDNDPAFHQGVLAAMDEATRDRASFDSHVSLIAAQRHHAVQRP